MFGGNIKQLDSYLGTDNYTNSRLFCICVI